MILRAGKHPETILWRIHHLVRSGCWSRTLDIEEKGLQDGAQTHDSDILTVRPGIARVGSLTSFESTLFDKSSLTAVLTSLSPTWRNNLAAKSSSYISFGVPMTIFNAFI